LQKLLEIENTTRNLGDFLVVNLCYFAKHFQEKLEKNLLFTIEAKLKILKKEKKKG
jgi:hypothetical protein